MNANRTTPPDHPQSLGELNQLCTRLAIEQRALQIESGELYAARQKTGAPPAVTNERVRNVHAQVASILNGSTPPEFLPPSVPREEAINIRIEALGLAMAVLTRRKQDAVARAAQEWADQHKDQWKAACREITLAGVRLFALEEKARAMLEAGTGGGIVTGLAMASHIGSGVSLLGIGAPLHEIIQDALAEGVVTKSEIAKAENVSAKS